MIEKEPREGLYAAHDSLGDIDSTVDVFANGAESDISGNLFVVFVHDTGRVIVRTNQLNQLPQIQTELYTHTTWLPTTSALTPHSHFPLIPSSILFTWQVDLNRACISKLHTSSTAPQRSETDSFQRLSIVEPYVSPTSPSGRTVRSSSVG
jgi:hypothetical protein